MKKLWPRLGTIALLTSVGLFCLTGVAEAQRGGGGRGGGASHGGAGTWHGGGGAWHGGGGNWHGGNWHGGNWHGGWYGRGGWGWWGPGWGFGLALGYPYYGGYYGGYYPSYAYDYPYYGGYYSAYPGYYNPYYGYGPTTYQSLYSPAGTARMPTTHLTIRVPEPNAQLTVNGKQMVQQGLTREFDTPPLESGYNYSYEVKVRWMKDGQPAEQTRTVRFQPGQQIALDFGQPQGQGPTPRPDAPPVPRED